MQSTAMVKVAEMMHIVMVPWPSQGHLNGILRLARYLVDEEGVLVTFVYPNCLYQLALNRGQSKAALSKTAEDAGANAATTPLFLSENLHIEVVEDGLPLDKAPDLGSFASSISTFRQGVQLLLRELIRPAPSLCSNGDGLKSYTHSWPTPRCVVADTFIPWVQDLADAVGIPRVDFWTSTAAVYSMGSQMELLVSKGVLPLSKSCWVDQDTKWTAIAPFIEGAPGLPPFPVTELPVEFIRPEAATAPEFQFMLNAFSRIPEAHTILIHTLHELERPVIEGLRAAELPVYAVGPLPEGLPFTTGSASSAVATNDCLQWLDTQSPCSVVYVALGTIVKPTAAELHSLALGLEASQRPFLWVIRPDLIGTNQSLADALPSGFLQRTVDRGHALVVPWAPQTQVLAHASIGVFLSHCGWNSTLESMLEGVPMVACPRAAEQRSNAKWITEIWKMGVAMEMREDGSFSKEAVESALRNALSEDGSVFFRKQARHFKQLARAAFQREGSSRANIQHFLRILRSLNEQNSGKEQHQEGSAKSFIGVLGSFAS